MVVVGEVTTWAAVEVAVVDGVAVEPSVVLVGCGVVVVGVVLIEAACDSDSEQGEGVGRENSVSR